MSNVIILESPEDPEERKEEHSFMFLDPGQVKAALELVEIHLAVPKTKRLKDKDIIRLASRVLLAKADDPVMLRVMGRTG